VHLWDELAAFSGFIQEGKERGMLVDKPCLAGIYGEEPKQTLCTNPDNYVL
jgi:hypothetical protein